MIFNKYIWDLYRNSKEGIDDIAMFKKMGIQLLSDQFGFDYHFDYLDENNEVQDANAYHGMMDELKDTSLEDFDQARKLFFEKVIHYIEEDKFNMFMEFLGAYSTALFHSFPNYFIPFYFTSDSYPEFLKLCDNFNIMLPQLPPRHDWVRRTWYYFEICETLHKFRNNLGIDALEFSAFLYFFGLKSLEKTKEEDLPKPSKIYFLGAGAIGGKEDENPDFIFLDKAENHSSNTWGAGNLNIKKGDLVLMYCVSPRKYLHSIWRAIEDSFIDPFRFHYYCIKVGFPQKIEPVGFHELKENVIFKNSPTVRSNMQGMNGRPLSVNEYLELISMLGEKGQNTTGLPKLPVYERDVDNVENERDVEQKLIEPLLKDIGIKDTEWMRQMPLKMGRQTSYYPDYAIFHNIKKGQEKAKVVLEAKYSINSDKQFQEAFDQARSYALRLQAQKIVLADRDFVWIFIKSKEGFISKHNLKFHWNELANSDHHHKLKTTLLDK